MSYQYDSLLMNPLYTFGFFILFWFDTITWDRLLDTSRGVRLKFLKNIFFFLKIVFTFTNSNNVAYIMAKF